MAKDFNGLPKGIKDMIENIEKLNLKVPDAYGNALKNYSSGINAAKNATNFGMNNSLSKGYGSSYRAGEALLKIAMPHNSVFEQLKKLDVFKNNLNIHFKEYNSFNYPWKSVFPKEYFRSDVSNTMQLISASAFKLENNIKNLNLNNSKWYVSGSNDFSIRDGIIASLNLDLNESNNEKYSDEIITNIGNLLKNTNSIIENVSENSEEAFKHLNNFLIEIFKSNLVKKGRKHISAILIAVVIAVLTNLATNVIEGSEQDNQTIVHNDQKTVINNNIIVINNVIIVDDANTIIETGKEYITTKIKGLKSDRIKTLKNILEIPIGTKVTVIKKYIKWIVVSYIENGEIMCGYTEIDGLVEFKKQ
jgi:hypothetical protein